MDLDGSFVIKPKYKKIKEFIFNYNDDPRVSAFLLSDAEKVLDSSFTDIFYDGELLKGFEPSFRIPYADDSIILLNSYSNTPDKPFKLTGWLIKDKAFIKTNDKHYNYFEQCQMYNDSALNELAVNNKKLADFISRNMC